ncbi:MAG: long-chain fatty acid--CoA ligase [Chloroflexota bacterium]|nr:MAG: long-chain fatty acid--CoA ligase [Chloroflexota bacterium]
MVDMDLLLALASHARYRPDQLAVAFEDERLTYRQLERRVSQIVAAFRRLDLAPGDRIGIATYRGVDPVALYLGSQAAGLQPVMLSWTLGPALPEMAEALGVEHLFVGAEAAGLHNLATSGAQVWDVGGHTADIGGFLAQSEAEDERWIVRRDPDQVSSVEFSAGSTGRPKAILRTVRSDVWNAWQRILAYRACEGDRWLCITPMNLSVLSGMVRAVLVLGGSLVLLERFDAARTVAAIRDGVTILPLQTPHWSQILEQPDLGDIAEPRLRTAVAIGQRIPVGLARRITAAFPRADFVVSYGTSESGMITALSATDPAFGTPSCVGRPLPTLEVEVVDEGGRPVPPGVRGDICVRGPSVVAGYDPAVGPIVSSMYDDWFNTGDVGQWDQRGYLYVIDRRSDVFESEGQLVFPGEIQEEVSRLPNVREVAVAGVQLEEECQATVFVVSDRDNPDIASIASIEAAVARVSQVSFRIRSVDRLPRTLGGKLDRVALKRGQW